MLVSDFNFELPEELIAQQPPAERSGARMLVLDRQSGRWRDAWFSDFPDLLHPGDVLVLNDSRVIPARLLGHKASVAQSGKIEALLTQQVNEWEWTALVRPGRKVLLGDTLVFASDNGTSLTAEVVDRGEFGERLLRFHPVPNFFSQLEKVGHMPLPPYIRRQDTSGDRQRYQTVFAERPGSAAAPTAGLHFTPEVLERIRARGVTVVFITLHVGLGTFQPVRVDRVEDIRLHAEPYTLPAQTADAINAALAENRRVIAAGTTTVRTLEHCALAAKGRPLAAHAGTTSIFISPGYEFRIVSGLLTNFHLPQSTLLMLVSAFAGREAALAAYRHAIAERYRFFSYGDCMFLS
ncbi:S-adenosylmethionine:tRNA ribosyltransferase-isomerase [Acidisarcina polymorpha]|uniref:S-adenosylmethionine:tRNA ribosyltransferase-isomerase n=1 Tax=Acidisarcina polymorpha TaxID=2211140 RepID=A0A2Z5FX32_9BACT|nr:tRNA preQ1(34) S-adenosylmethionine ribosyltransferase-isomerase QueA [Acidisarcina polymorpha]AXC11074.1 S-adenosylmethionine:tRNA ribosyltransferase-isomerase [Acidisarcina polymorpha]